MPKINTEPFGYLLITILVDAENNTKILHDRCKFTDEVAAFVADYELYHHVVSSKIYEISREIKL